MKKIVFGVVSLLAASSVWASVHVSALQGTTEIPQWKYLGTDAKNPEWFSRYSASIDTVTLQAFKNAPGNVNGLDLYAASSTVKISYLGTGATRNSNLFLAHAGVDSFDTAAFWSPIYASGGSNNLNAYNPVNADNALFETRSGCSFAQAKAGNTCSVTQIGMTREITGVNVGDNLVFGLQALPLVYNGGGTNINLPHTHYFFTGTSANNSDSKGWADSTFHAKVLQVGTNEYLVGFEDMWLGSGSKSDRDYNDMVFLFQGINIPAIPEPETNLMILLGGAMTIAAARRKRRA